MSVLSLYGYVMDLMGQTERYGVMLGVKFHYLSPNQAAVCSTKDIR